MKNLFKSLMLIAVAAMASTSCSTEQTEDLAPIYKFSVSANAVTGEVSRSTFGEPNGTSYPTLWEGNEEIILNVNADAGKTTESTEVKFSDDKRSAYISAEFELSSVPESYTLYALSPASACVYAGITADKGWQVTIPTSQTPIATSCDPKAQVLIGSSESKATVAEPFTMTFKHAVAYGKLTLSNLDLNGATVQSVTLTSAKNIAGRYYINHTNAAYTDNSGSQSITINTSSVENVWFACAPVDVSNTVLKITVGTDKGTFTKEVTMPANREFAVGNIAKFTVDMSGIALVAPVKYQLLTNISNLTVGSKVVIAASASNVAISSTQNNNNRGQASITKSSDKSSISDPGDAVEVFMVEEGSVSGSFALKATKQAGYIYAASSSSNYLRTQTTKNANASWSITVTSAGVATIKAQGTNTRNWLRHNSSSSLFSCYGSGQADVVIYYIPGEEQEPDTTPSIVPQSASIEVEADATSAEVNITLNNITEEVDAEWTADWITDAWVEDGVLYIECKANDTTNERPATITMTANGATATVTVTQKGKVPTTVETLPTIDKTAYYTFKKATTFSSAKWYAIVANGKAATALTSNYGYLQVINAQTAETIVLPANCAFGFTSTDGGYLMQQYDSKYMYQTGTYDSFNVSTSIPTEGGVWSVDYTDNTASIKNISVEKYIQYDTTYNSYGSYSSQTYVKPALYELVEVSNEPILISLSSTALTFSYEGGAQSVTATTYATATLSATSNVDWATATVSGNTITITATENSTTETRNGVITVTYGDSSKTVAVAQGGVPTGDSTTTTLTFEDNTTFNQWNSSYIARTIEFNEATVKFSSANKQTGTITTMPVTKGQPVEIIMKNGYILSSIALNCKQWGSKAQTITLHYSTDGGSTYTKTTTTASNFELTASSLPEGTNAVKFTFSSTSNQIGIASAEITYNN